MELSVHSLICFMIIILPMIQFYKSVDADEHEECRPFRCGTVNITYPFYDGNSRPAHCGYPGFEFSCTNDEQWPEITVTTSSERYYLLQMDPDSQTVTVARQDLWSSGNSNDYYCPNSFYNTTLNFTRFNYTPENDNITLYYNCSLPPPSPGGFQRNQFSCSDDDDSHSAYFMTPFDPIDYSNMFLRSCNQSIIIPVFNRSYVSSSEIGNLRAFQAGFELNWIADNESCRECRGIGGECGSNNTGGFACYCPVNVHHPICPVNGEFKSIKLRTTLIVIASSVIGFAMIVVVLLYFLRGMASQKKERRNSENVEAMLRHYGEHAPKRYTYGEIKKMTSCFKDKLGEGGYGDVYKGKLQNGFPVAVKFLKNPNCDGTEFANEVASISGTNHINIVTLLGYCFQVNKKALVYDFMPNGSLDKYIYSGKNQNPVAWETLFQIAIGIGKGLEYLHQGCRTRILHFDIKPHNILLDAKFCPKISDFGLAKPCLQTKSLMTMSGTRGTPGYIAPEVFCRGFGGASHKSDVYSYGMLVLDLVGCRKNNVAGSEKTGSELYFPHWIYKQFELKEDGELLGISNDEEKVLQRKLVIVGLWCIQTNPSRRPSISRAVEMLEGDLELLQIPPMPTLSSPPRSHHHDSTTDSTHTMTL